MISTINTRFTIKMNSGLIATTWQSDNGIHHAEIRDSHGDIESTITCNTSLDVHTWVLEHDTN